MTALLAHAETRLNKMLGNTNAAEQNQFAPHGCGELYSAEGPDKTQVTMATSLKLRCRPTRPPTTLRAEFQNRLVNVLNNENSVHDHSLSTSHSRSAFHWIDWLKSFIN